MLTALLLLAGFAPAPVSTTDFDVDSGHSTVMFQVKHLQTAEFFGRFNDVSGKIAFDPKNLDKSVVTVVVKAASVDTNSEGRETHLKGPQFFDAANHPDITFSATGFKKNGKDSYDVKGKLTMRGVTKELAVTVKHTGEAKDPWGGYRIGFLTSFKIKRTEFGINFPLTMLGDEVTLTVSLEGMRKLGDDEK